MSFDASSFLACLDRGRTTVRDSAVVRVREAGSRLLGAALGEGDFPFATGSLAASGTTQEPVWTGDGELLAEVTFGGPAEGMPHDPVIYAEAVHEGYHLIAWGHDTNRELPGRPYLAGPLDEQGGQLVEDAMVAVWQDVEEAWSAT